MRVTVFEKAGEMITGSSYGDVTWQEWCEKEVARLGSHGVDAKIITSSGGRIAVVKT